MKYNLLSNTTEKVSAIGLGTMMWGDQVDEDQAHKQMYLALEYGVNFWDTAELYTIPAKAETQGNTEKYIGNFFKQNPSARKNVVLASKFVARGIRKMDWFREGNHFADSKNINKAFEESCKRLNTDTIDLYQIHWPDRVVNIFGQRNYVHTPEEDGIDIFETATALKKMVDAGKIKYVGISNETPWGMMQWIAISREIDLPLVSIQNSYSLLNRTFELGNSEISMRENLGLLAYSPLAMGTLSGKYINNNLPIGSRRDIFPTYASRFNGEISIKATQEYVKIAKDYSLDPCQMSLTFVMSQPFVTSALMGATNESQLLSNFDSINVKLSDDIFQKIDQVYRAYPDPCC